MGFNETNYGETTLLNELELGGDLDLGEYDVYADNIRSLTQIALKNSLRLAINQDMVFHQFTDGAIDEFQDETGINAAVAYSFATGKYTLSPGGEATISNVSVSAYNATQYGSYLIDGNTATWWDAAGTDDKTIVLDMGSTVILSKISTYLASMVNPTVRIPDTVIVSGSNDGSNFTDIQTYTDQQARITVDTWMDFEFSSVAYRYYRLTLQDSTDMYSLSEIKAYFSVSENYLESISLAADESPELITGVVCFEGVTYEGVDLYISTDGGTTYEQMTLDQASEILSGVWMLSYSIAPTTPGSSIRWKLVSSIEGDVQGVGVCW